MRKSGLHKEIASIFDGVPVPSNDVLSEEAQTSDEQIEQPQQDTPAVSQTTDSSLLQRMNADPSDTPPADPIPVIQVGRPMPLQKSKITAKTATTKPALSAKLKKAVFGSNAIDPRQKKAGVLVGILSLVFGVVMFISLGGVGKTQAAAADAEGDNTAEQTQTAENTAQQWQRPEPLPQNLRDATTPVSNAASEQNTAIATEGSDQWVVKGIVFSQTKPSAIINNQILSEGDTLDGITVVKISKETVEFEQDGKQWTQSVQR